MVAALVAGGAAAQTREPPAAAPNYRTWEQYLGGADSSQYSALDQIDRSNVTDLEVAWTYETGEGGNYLFNPIVVDGVMYVLARNRSIVALDAATGRELWRRPTEGPVGTRGINYWESEDRTDRRLLFINQGHLTAIDARNGRTVNAFGQNGRVDLRVGLVDDVSTVRPLQTSNPGRIFENLVIVSLPAGGASYSSTPADVHAYDVRTGELEWVFHTVPRPGEFGADTWPNDAADAFGGVHNWSESTVDVERGIAFIPTGTARYDFYGANRHGDNLFGNSVVALDARTGERIWHFQTIHHDLWDFDLPQAPKLLTVMHEGREVDVVAQATKQGLLFVFDRETGEPLWPIEERPVPQSDAPGEQSSPTQPFPTKPPPFARMSFTEEDINPYIPEEDQEAVREILRTYRNEGLYTPPSLEGTIMLPGHNGGANWGSSAVDPVNGKMYVVSKELPTTAKLQVREPGTGGFGGPGGSGATPPAPPNAGPDFVEYTVPIDFMLQSNGLSALGPPWSQLTAYDLNDGTIEWQVPNGQVGYLAEQGITDTGSHAPRGGPVATAGGLLFVGTSSDRAFRAYDRDSGEVLWTYRLQAASEGVPAVYEVDGRQFITIATGGYGLFGIREGEEPGPGRYVTFALPEASE
ncbi:MAG: pyrroloquinoline quinone-dependent dehydrogenase [Gammaproteobacteria bacterium]|nr:pyrroloquinoline quinone-dependent dehydrogenase [Gammaproteobacteria bacterium]